VRPFLKLSLRKGAKEAKITTYTGNESVSNPQKRQKIPPGFITGSEK
jgi:hypothetical protein